jgi:UDP-glucose 4-epimerase
LPCFGTDYPTADATAVRDYVHVSNIVRANRLTLRYVTDGEPSATLNIGAGVGISVRQIVEAVARVHGRSVPVVEFPPRPGDPACAVSDSSRARKLLGWTPISSGIDFIVESALASRRLQLGAVGGAAAGGGP